MRDFRNAKAMAKTLREALARRSLQLSHTESLELVADILGCRNWQTLSALIDAESGGPSHVTSPVTAGLVPVTPMRDVVVFPEMTIPLFAGRLRTLRAVERAMATDQRVFIVAQRRVGDETPAIDDLFGIGVIAVVLGGAKLPNGTMKVMVQGQRRARLRSLQMGEFAQAEVEFLDDARPDDAARALAQEALARFSRFANFDLASPPIALTQLCAMVGDPGQFADLMAPLVARQLAHAQALLEMTRPAARLQTLITLMSEGQGAA